MNPPLSARYVWKSPSGVVFMRCTSAPSLSFASSSSQPLPQTTLMTFQPAPRKKLSSSWMILPLPRTGPSRRCRLQLTTNVRLSRPSFAATCSWPRLSTSSISPSPRNAQTCESASVLDPAVGEVLVRHRLVDGVDRAEAHRDRRELPVLRHEPRVRVGRDAVGRLRLLLAEAVELVLGEASLEERAGVDAGRGVALDEDLVAAGRVVEAAEEVVEADFVERGRRRVGRDVAADADAGALRAVHRDARRSSGSSGGSGARAPRRRGTRARSRARWC